MSSAFYENFRAVMVSGGDSGVHGVITLSAAGTNVKIILYDEGTTPLSLAHQDIADIAAGARIATSGNIGSKTVNSSGSTSGTFDHADVTFTAVAGNSIESLTYWKDTGTESTSPLIVNIDEGSITGLPLTPNGGDVNWVPSASGVFQIT